MVSSAVRPQDGWEQNFRLLFRDQTKFGQLRCKVEKRIQAGWLGGHCETGVVLRELLGTSRLVLWNSTVLG